MQGKHTFINGLLLVALACCMSSTVPEVRFEESAAMSPPNITANPADPNNFTFAMVADVHIKGAETSRLVTILQAAAAANDAFIVLLGDIVDAGLSADVNAVNTAIQANGFTGKVLPVIGNHDIFGDGWVYYKSVLGPSHYTVDIGNSRFIALDTADGTVGNSQASWLKEQLKRTPRTNTFILSHYLPVLPGVDHYLRLVNPTEAMSLMKLASSFLVRGWFGGHYHGYLNAAIEGVSYVGAGGGGGTRMPSPIADVPTEDFFYVQVTVQDAQVSYRRVRVP